VSSATSSIAATASIVDGAGGNDPGEANFARRLEHLLNKIHAPEYRHLTVEALRELAAIFTDNPDLQFEELHRAGCADWPRRPHRLGGWPP
jgi:hypothetical protein